LQEKKIMKLDETMENLDLWDQLEDLMICHDDASDKSTDTWKTGLELHEDDETTFSSFDNKFDNRYQVLVSWEFRDSSHGEAYRRGSTVVTRGLARYYANRDTTVYPGSGPSRVEVKPLLPACFVLSGQ
jgi:hypothetical protein